MQLQHIFVFYCKLWDVHVQASFTELFSCLLPSVTSSLDHALWIYMCEFVNACSPHTPVVLLATIFMRTFLFFRTSLVCNKPKMHEYFVVAVVRVCAAAQGWRVHFFLHQYYLWQRVCLVAWGQLLLNIERCAAERVMREISYTFSASTITRAEIFIMNGCWSNIFCCCSWITQLVANKLIGYIENQTYSLNICKQKKSETC